MLLTQKLKKIRNDKSYNLVYKLCELLDDKNIKCSLKYDREIDMYYLFYKNIKISIKYIEKPNYTDIAFYKKEGKYYYYLDYAKTPKEAVKYLLNLINEKNI